MKAEFLKSVSRLTSPFVVTCLRNFRLQFIPLNVKRERFQRREVWSKGLFTGWQDCLTIWHARAKDYLLSLLYSKITPSPPNANIIFCRVKSRQQSEIYWLARLILHALTLFRSWKFFVLSRTAGYLFREYILVLRRQSVRAVIFQDNVIHSIIALSII